MSKHPTPDMLTDSRQAVTLGKLLVESNQFPDVGGPAEVAVKILAGKELGVGPVQAVGSLQLVNGKIVLEPSMMASLIQRSDRYGYRVTQHDETRCEIEFCRDSDPIGTSVFTAEEAERAGLTEGSAWQSSTRNVLFEGAIRNGARWYCPELFGGVVYTPQEFGPDELNVTSRGGSGIEIDAKVVGDTEAQDVVSQLASLILQTNTIEGQLLAHYNVKSLDELTVEQRQQAIGVLTTRLNKNQTT